MEQQTFDIETGMTVYGENGQIVGTVTAIQGFGSTRIQPAADSTDAPATQAQTGTGYVKVGRPGMGELFVPFNRIQEVISGRGVNLTTTTLDALREEVDTRPQQADVSAQPRGWSGNLAQLRRWLPWGRSQAGVSDGSRR